MCATSPILWPWYQQACAAGIVGTNTFRRGCSHLATHTIPTCTFTLAPQLAAAQQLPYQPPAPASPAQAAHPCAAAPLHARGWLSALHPVSVPALPAIPGSPALEPFRTHSTQAGRQAAVSMDQSAEANMAQISRSGADTSRACLVATGNWYLRRHCRHGSAWRFAGNCLHAVYGCCDHLVDARPRDAGTPGAADCLECPASCICALSPQENTHGAHASLHAAAACACGGRVCCYAVACTCEVKLGSHAFPLLQPLVVGLLLLTACRQSTCVTLRCLQVGPVNSSRY
jgi:hypothetical protein